MPTYCPSLGTNFCIFQLFLWHLHTLVFLNNTYLLLSLFCIFSTNFLGLSFWDLTTLFALSSQYSYNFDENSIYCLLLIIMPMQILYDNICFLFYFLLLLKLIIIPLAIILSIVFISLIAMFFLTLGHLQLHFFLKEIL